MDNAARLDDPPRNRQGSSVRFSESLWKHLMTLFNFLLGPFRNLLHTVLAYRSVYTLSVHDPGCSCSIGSGQSSTPHHQLIGVYASAEAARVAVTEILQLPEYRGRALHMGFPVHGQADLGTRIGCACSTFEAGNWHDRRLVLLVESMVVRKKG